VFGFFAPAREWDNFVQFEAHFALDEFAQRDIAAEKLPLSATSDRLAFPAAPFNWRTRRETRFTRTLG